MTSPDPQPEARVSGDLPLLPTASYDRTGLVCFDDRPAASPFDVSGMSLVTSCVTSRFGLPDLLDEAAAVGIVSPVALTFDSPYAVLDGARVTSAGLLAPDKLSAWRRFVDGVEFAFPDGTMRAFLHAVVIALPGSVAPVALESLWVDFRTSQLAAALKTGDAAGRLSAQPEPPALTLWTVGLESSSAVPARRSVRLRSGFVAVLDRSAL